ncbi:hypothetical protein B0H14DRAFT_3136555, partial [Mycena olivaceomarginata]
MPPAHRALVNGANLQSVVPLPLRAVSLSFLAAPCLFSHDPSRTARLHGSPPPPRKAPPLHITPHSSSPPPHFFLPCQRRLCPLPRHFRSPRSNSSPGKDPTHRCSTYRRP